MRGLDSGGRFGLLGDGGAGAPSGFGGRGWVRRLVLLAVVLWVSSLGLSGPSRAAGSVYVTNVHNNNLSEYTLGAGGALSPQTPATLASGVEPRVVAVDPDGRSAYVTNGADGTVSQYDVNPLTGALSPKTPATIAAGTEAFGLAVSPDGKSAYVANQGADTISQYDIDPVTGALTPKTPATLATGPGPRAVAVSPDGRSAYVTNLAFSTVSQYDINPLTGALSPKTPATVAGGSDPFTIAVSPDGKSAYVTDQAGAAVSQYDINGVTGALSPKTPATVATGNSPWGVAVSPDGKSAYVTNLTEDTVAQYDINGVTGALSPKAPATVATGFEPWAVAVNLDGRSAYVTNFDANTVSQYDIDPLTGALSPKTPATVAAGTGPTGIAAGPLPLVINHPTATSVNCSPGTVAPGDPSTCTATVTDTAAGGQDTPSGTVAFATGGAGTFAPASSCTLSGSGPSASCSASYASLTPGVDTITASYSGDATHAGSNGQASVTVAVPTSTRACRIEGYGSITASNGDRARFRLDVQTESSGGEHALDGRLGYRDDGLAQPFKLHSSHIQAVVCSGHGNQGSVFALGTLNRTQPVIIRVDVTAGGHEIGASYRIRLSSGYESARQTLRTGEIQIETSSRNHDDW